MGAHRRETSALVRDLVVSMGHEHACTRARGHKGAHKHACARAGHRDGPQGCAQARDWRTCAQARGHKSAHKRETCARKREKGALVPELVATMACTPKRRVRIFLTLFPGPNAQARLATQTYQNWCQNVSKARFLTLSSDTSPPAADALKLVSKRDENTAWLKMLVRGHVSKTNEA